MPHKKSKVTKKVAEAAGLDRDAVEMTTDFLKDNAVPLTMVAVGAGLLAARTMGNGHRPVSSATERAAEMASERIARAGEMAQEATGEAVRMARDGAEVFADTIREHPVMAGIAALAIGAGVAAMSMPRGQHSAGK